MAFVLTIGSRRVFAAAWVLCLVTVGGCVSLRTTGADTIRDLQAEDNYKAVYAAHMSKIYLDSQPFAQTSASPGVCNKDGTKQGCYDADTQLMLDLQALHNALVATPVPPRFVVADKLLREAIFEDVQALELRNQAIAQNDDALFQQHKVALEKAFEALQQAYQAFPEDNRPQPPP